MQLATNGSSAYKLDEMYENKPVSKPKQKQIKKTVKIKKTRYLMAIACGFLVMFLICFRYVNIYGLHSDISSKTSQLNKIKMENEQISLAIDSMIDSSKVEEFATKNLGLSKIENRQIIYIQPVQEDSMKNVAKNGKKSVTKGFFGMISGVMEYLQ